ncbi:MAG: hypothetical protein IT564_12720 [Rhodospirillales bacterium]|nr:hypothetical protein [Rhodospirillales bacterium]
MTTETKYAIVRSHGRYSSGDTIRPMAWRRDLAAAKKLAAKWSRAHQDAMRAYGGTSGGYRVVPWRESWLGVDLDRVPSL